MAHDDALLPPSTAVIRVNLCLNGTSAGVDVNDGKTASKAEEPVARRRMAHSESVAPENNRECVFSESRSVG
eukprot:CAMPEP_0198319824 /NCGR_PEP_ID=MMETSP1450-20131203/8876_1 /TAXON_ID=753684 ORGANISM="Madagascaria erythrocladiodes, Strain CCMP3234" /NCGR_SAMPLE_ID=MMETSP1450 /ASSEMBLY_ACC=CAM_ASM_001115 /LENGTH=71 /DNA_ID=CAMNT_0044023241 /DNA_START=531 /DNA_END=746 /DNA_ORIENTATION=+